TEQIVLDVGSNIDDNNVYDYDFYLYYSPEYQDWGDPYILDNRTVRNYEDRGGKYAHAPFEFLVDFQLLNTYYLEITYKDTASDPVYIEIGPKYVRFAQLEKEADDSWKTLKVHIPIDLLIFQKGTSLQYHEWHIKQLQVLYQITGETIFKDYAQIFNNYYEAFLSNIVWLDFFNEIKEGVNKEL
ncbi:unnamed protein product, partial [marine sediment metagenome]